MTSLKNSISPSDWKFYPSETEWLSAIRLIVPVASGIYGMPGNQVALTSNHQSSLAHLANTDGITAFVLDGGGFPVEIAATLGLINPPPDDFFRKYIEYVGVEVIFLIPESLSLIWNWKDGDARLGGTIHVVSDIFLSSSIRGFSPVAIRFYTVLRLALAQMILLLLPIIIINPRAFIPAAIMLIIGSCLIAGLWDYLPSNGWGKSALVGFSCAILTALFTLFQIFPFHLFFSVGIFIMVFWMGGLLGGARSS
jgi:hypothetical protein